MGSEEQNHSQASAPPDMAHAASERLARLEGAIDVLLVEKKKKHPFFEPGFMVAVAALMLSLATTVYTSIRESNQRIDTLTAQLRTTLNQFGDIALKVTEGKIKYKDNGEALNDVISWAGVQNTVLTVEAMHLANELGRNAGIVDLMTIANRLRFIGKFGEAELVLKKALLLDASLTDSLAVERELGTLMYVEKKADAADPFKKAISKIEENEGFASNSYLSYEISLTYLTWAMAETGSDCGSANGHLGKSIEWAQTAKSNDQYKGQIAYVKEQLRKLCGA